MSEQILKALTAEAEEDFQIFLKSLPSPPPPGAVRILGLAFHCGAIAALARLSAKTEAEITKRAAQRSGAV